jgi:hypothetical protein
MDVLLPQHIEYCSALMSNLRLNGYWTDTVNIGGQELWIVADGVDKRLNLALGFVLYHGSPSMVPIQVAVLGCSPQKTLPSVPRPSPTSVAQNSRSPIHVLISANSRPLLQG